MRVKLVVGNWKMNGDLASNQALLEAVVPAIVPLTGIKCALCVPFPYLGQTRQMLSGTSLAWGAQDLCQYDNGAYTGGVSAAMLTDFGCRYVIVGHSERRSVFGETDDVVSAKFDAASRAGLTPILCVGETLPQRDAGVTETTIARQLDSVIARSGAAALARAVIAYEPVWAIGTGRTATPEQAQAVHAFIRGRVDATEPAAGSALPMLYGGSVKAANSANLFAMPDIDGGLIGGASLIADEFAAICSTAQR